MPDLSRTVHLAVHDTLADWQYGLVVAHLVGHPHRQRLTGGFTLRTVGETRDPIVTTAGIRIVPDLTLDELRPADSAMLVLAGGDDWVPLYDLRPGASPAGERPGLLFPFAHKARELVDAGVPVAAIGGATSGLARVGVLDDVDHTSDVRAFLDGSGYAGGHRFREALAVTDGDVITASGIAPVEFAREVFARLDVFEPHVLDIWYRLYGAQDGGALGDMMAAKQPAHA